MYVVSLAKFISFPKCSDLVIYSQEIWFTFKSPRKEKIERISVMNNTDSTSFQSILAGVKRLREKEGGSDNVGQQPKDVPKAVVSPSKSESVKATEVTNAFNQQRQYQPASDANIVPSNKGSGNLNTLSSKAVLVNTTQKENPLLNHLKNTNWRYISSTKGTKIYYDYLVKRRSVLFLTLTYHKLYAEYIDRRMLPLQQNGDNILIFVVDDTNSEDVLKDLTKLCMFKGFTLLLAFNFEQAAKYIEYLNR